MAFMNLFSASSMMIAQPTGLWESIIFAFEEVIPSYAWTIIVFTLILKLVMSPLDFFNKKFSRQNAKMQKIMQPELAALQQKYAADKDMLNQKTMELYKKHNYNVVGSCGIMLANLVITFVVFITLFNGLNAIGKFKIEEQYYDLKAVYEANIAISEEAANTAVLAEYNEISEKYSFLWIKNVWQSDTPFNNSILTFDQFNNVVKLDSTVVEAERATYALVMDPLREEVGGPNGYLIIVVLSAGFTLLAQIFSQSTIKRKKGLVAGDTTAPQGGKMMLILMPLLMGSITYSFNSALGLYVTVGALFGLLTTPFMNYLVDVFEQKSNDKKAIIVKPTYSR